MKPKCPNPRHTIVGQLCPMCRAEKKVIQSREEMMVAILTRNELIYAYKSMRAKAPIIHRRKKR